MELLQSRIASPLGPLLALCDADGTLVALEYADHAARLDAWRARHRPGARVARAPAPRALEAALARYFAGELAAIDAVAVRMEGTPFQRRCWQALRTIAPGRPASYAAQAAAIGMPRAARAVGRANALNPLEIVVPCHRVVGADAALTGYAGGLERKAWLLAHEAAHTRCADHAGAAPAHDRAAAGGAAGGAAGVAAGVAADAAAGRTVGIEAGSAVACAADRMTAA